VEELERKKGKRGKGKVGEGCGGGAGVTGGEKENLTLYSFVSLRPL